MARHDVALNLPLMTAHLMKYSDADRGILQTVHTRMKYQCWQVFH